MSDEEADAPEHDDLLSAVRKLDSSKPKLRKKLAGVDLTAHETPANQVLPVTVYTRLLCVEGNYIGFQFQNLPLNLFQNLSGSNNYLYPIHVHGCL